MGTGTCHLQQLSNDNKSTIKMLTATYSDGPAFNMRSKTSHQTATNTEPPSTHPNKDTITLDFTTMKSTQDITPKPLRNDRLQALLQMQKTDPFCQCIPKQLSSGKSPKHEADLFTHVQGLLYKHFMDTNQKFMALIIPKAWKYTILVEAHDKLGHQGVIHTYCLIK